MMNKQRKIGKNKSIFQTAEVIFYIENDNGDKEKAIENFKLSKVNEPYVVNMSLNFKRYPWCL